MIEESGLSSVLIFFHPPLPSDTRIGHVLGLNSASSLANFSASNSSVSKESSEGGVDFLGGVGGDEAGGGGDGVVGVGNGVMVGSGGLAGVFFDVG